MPIVVTENEFLAHGELIHSEGKSISISLSEERFKAFFKVSPKLASKIWYLLHKHTRMPLLTKPRHLLWALFFMNDYGSERIQSRVLGCDPKTFRKYVWPMIGYIYTLRRTIVSCWSKCYMNSVDNLCQSLLNVFFCLHLDNVQID